MTFCITSAPSASAKSATACSQAGGAQPQQPQQPQAPRLPTAHEVAQEALHFVYLDVEQAGEDIVHFSELFAPSDATLRVRALLGGRGEEGARSCVVHALVPHAAACNAAACCCFHGCCMQGCLWILHMRTRTRQQHNAMCAPHTRPLQCLLSMVHQMLYLDAFSKATSLQQEAAGRAKARAEQLLHMQDLLAQQALAQAQAAQQAAAQHEGPAGGADAASALLLAAGGLEVADDEGEVFRLPDADVARLAAMGIADVAAEELSETDEEAFYNPAGEAASLGACFLCIAVFCCSRLCIVAAALRDVHPGHVVLPCACLLPPAAA